MHQLEQLCLVGSLTLAAIALAAASAGFAQVGGATTAVSGRGEYDYTCVQCHGNGMDGHGVMAHYLKYTRPPDRACVKQPWSLSREAGEGDH